MRLVWAGAAAVLMGLVLLITPTGVHHDGNCGSALAARHPVLRNDDLLEEQVAADGDCVGERRFRALSAAVAVAGGTVVIIVGSRRHSRRDSTLRA
jgi:hypothetical protein